MTFICHVCGKYLDPYELHSCAGALATSNATVMPGSSAATEHVVLREHLADCPPSLSIYPDAAERRRYALLQAAAVILSHPDENGEFPLPESAVKSAQNLLAIIERREQERANG